MNSAEEKMAFNRMNAASKLAREAMSEAMAEQAASTGKQR
jgi:hypothetical protein